MERDKKRNLEMDDAVEQETQTTGTSNMDGNINENQNGNTK